MRWDAIALDPADDVAVALRDVAAGTVRVRQGDTVRLLAVPAPIALGHKLALRALSPGDAIRKYGQPIGAATAAIAPGEHVHVHNLRSLRGGRRA
ncbi:MAG: D-galactarate dehydratase [Alphaproteobacteria bacterium]|nr:D-galactarate dehydratase [Alphaproteobacteria bacterium]MBM3627699.1 D-galactarate dehydratase [Alphaproteobacteria bacterium]